MHHLKLKEQKILTFQDLGIPSTAVSIRILSLPSNGSLQVSNSNVAVGDVITVASINASNFTFVPSSSDTTKIDFTFESIKADNSIISSIDNIYPVDTTVLATSANYKADAGDFDSNTSNGGTAAGGGNFDNQSSAGGFPVVEAGDFDTGRTISLPQPILPGTASGANGDTDYESGSGVAVKDGDDNQIDIETLPRGKGDTEGTFDIIVEANLSLNSACILQAYVVETETFDYGYILNKFGYAVDFGTIATPNTFNASFGTIEAETEPTIASYVS